MGQQRQQLQQRQRQQVLLVSHSLIHSLLPIILAPNSCCRAVLSCAVQSQCCLSLNLESSPRAHCFCSFYHCRQNKNGQIWKREKERRKERISRVREWQAEVPVSVERYHHLPGCYWALQVECCLSTFISKVLAGELLSPPLLPPPSAPLVERL